MTKNSQKDDVEIDFIELMLTVWRGKWKIAVTVIISLIAITSYQSFQTKQYTVITEIKPIDKLAMNKYVFFNNTIRQNNFNFQKITKLSLLNLYIDTLNDKSVFEDAMLKLNFLDASQYSDEQTYNDAIIKLASSVKILTPLVDIKKLGKLEISYHTVNFIHDDVKKWQNVLIYADEIANQIVKKKILENYKNSLSFLKHNKEYQIEIIKKLIINTQIDFDYEMKKLDMIREFQLEDIQTKIDNAMVDYDRETVNRLAFLREQEAIARKLKVAKNTIEAQTFSSQNGMVANIETNTPFYLRGYEAIEKEIELIQARDDKRAFVKGLLKLEQEKRSLEQDRTLLRVEKNTVFLDSFIELKKKQRAIEQDKTIEQIELAFQLTPLANNNEFSAAFAKVLTSKFENNNNNNLVPTIMIALIAGIFYVLISNKFQSHRVFKKKTN